MIDLPRGKYSFFAFILDTGAKSLLDSTIYAIGLPSKEEFNNPELEDFYLEYPVNIENSIDTSPIDIKRGGPFYISLIMIDINEIPDCHTLFSKLLQQDDQSPSL
jgi:hypothetical protein